MPEQRKLWRLNVGGSRFLGLRPHDLSYFNVYFNGGEIETPWSPPPIAISGKSKKLPDFVSWMMGAPVVSESAKDALLTLVGDTVQFLPFHALKERPYYALNVVEVLHNLLDEAQSEFSRFSSDGTIFSIDRAVFLEPLPKTLPPIFKLGEGTGAIFVTTPFAELVVERQLTGVQLLAPSQHILRLTLGKEALTAYPGTPPVDA
jgi:hypothetical protein